MGNSIRTWDLYCNFQLKAIVSLGNRYATTSCSCSDEIALDTKKNRLCAIADILKIILNLLAPVKFEWNWGKYFST